MGWIFCRNYALCLFRPNENAQMLVVPEIKTRSPATQTEHAKEFKFTPVPAAHTCREIQ